jgi:hypothetical protein
MGGNKRKSYVDGWVEFQNKRDAKLVAKALNATPIGGRSTSFFSADLWNLKYLSGFKWKHLTEKIAYDNAVRRQKLQAEIAQAKREKDFYMERVEQNKRIAKRQNKAAEDIASAERDAKSGGKKEAPVLRTFRQSKPITSSQPGANSKHECVFWLHGHTSPMTLSIFLYFVENVSPLWNHTAIHEKVPKHRVFFLPTMRHSVLERIRDCRFARRCSTAKGKHKQQFTFKDIWEQICIIAGHLYSVLNIV